MANKNTNNINNKPKSNKTKTTQQASPKGTPGAKKQIGATIAAGTAARTSKTIIIVSIIASVALVLLSILGIFAVSGASFGKNAKEINYLRANLNRYISFPDGAYKNIEVDIPLFEYTDEQLQRKINVLLVENKDETPKYNGLGMISVPITLGDVVKIYYRGYKVDENGKQTEFDGSSNFTDATPYSLEIGSATFIPGFEDALIGVTPSDYATFSTIHSGEVTADMVVYISYTALYPDGKSATATNKRIDLSRTDLDEELGEGFRAFLLGEGEGATPVKIGEKVSAKTFPYGEGSAGYSDIVVSFATKCETNPCTIDVTFPADYAEVSLRGVAVKFDVFPSSVVVYDTPEFNEEFLTEKLEIKAEDYADYEGETLVEKYKASQKEYMTKALDTANVKLIMDALWDVFKEKVEVKKLPKRSVSKYYNAYYAEVENYYVSNSQYFNSIDEAAIQYLAVSKDSDWRAYVKEMAEDSVLEKIIFYYIIRKEDFTPSRAEYNTLYDEIYNQHLDEYIEENSGNLSKLEGTAYDNEYKRLEAEMRKEYTENYFKECVYFEYGTRKITANLAIIK